LLLSKRGREVLNAAIAGWVQLLTAPVVCRPVYGLLREQKGNSHHWQQQDEGQRRKAHKKLQNPAIIPTMRKVV
jgi:hypothetical protein